MSKLFFFIKGSGDRQLASSLLIVFLLVSLLSLVFEPRWHTNDDVAMSMIAHGYGLVEYGSPKLIFSNILWGEFVRIIPTVYGVLGYSTASVLALLMAGWSTLYFLLRLGTGYPVGILVIVLLLARPVLFPQFTINAGLLTVAGIIGLQVYLRHKGYGILIASILLAFIGYLVRVEEFLLVLGVSLPFLPWRLLKKDRSLQLATVTFLVCAVWAGLLNNRAYSGEEWQEFRQFNPVRVALHDFGMGEKLIQREDILGEFGYSKNDIELASNWFFLDKKIIDPEKLEAMLDRLDPSLARFDNYKSGFKGLLGFVDPFLIPILFAAVCVLIMIPRHSVYLAWLLCLMAIFVIGAMGRPGVVRIYIPLLSLLFLAPVMLASWQAAPVRRIAYVLIVACICNIILLVPQAINSLKWMEKQRAGIKYLPETMIYIWGGQSFPYEWIYPVWASDESVRRMDLYGLNWLTLTPYSVANAQEKIGMGMIRRLESGQRIMLLATTEQIVLLGRYCQEHMGRELRSVAAPESGSSYAWHVSCEINNQI